MNRQSCHERHLSASSIENDNVTISSSPAEGLGSEAYAEPWSSSRGEMNAMDDHGESDDPVSPSEPVTLPLPLSTSVIPILTTPLPPLNPKRRTSSGSLGPRKPSISRFWSRSSRPLQLPPFENLGISTPALSASGPRTCSRNDFSPSNATDRTPTCVVGKKELARADYPPKLPLTPPAEIDERVAWNPRGDSAIAGSQTSHGTKPDSREPPSKSPDDQTSGSDSAAGDDAGMTGGRVRDWQKSGSWLADGIEATLSSLLLSDVRGEAVKIVSHTLPYPRAPDEQVKLPTQNPVFGWMVQTIQNRLQPGLSPYINVIHAVPKQFRLSNLPSSPPSTPGFLLPGDDYFTSTVFSSATPVPDYHDFRGRIQPSQFPSVIVPPHSVQVAVVERYLPPASSQEYTDFFSPNGPSILVDRLLELSPNGGSLLLIYPTKRGARSFHTHYLGPILDPLLRQLVVVNELSADVGKHLGNLASVAHMDDFETMRANIVRLGETFSTSASRFTLVDAGKGSAFLDRNLWSEWFIQQERSRMKEVLNLYWQNSRRAPKYSPVPSGNRVLNDKEVTSAMLLTDILDGLKKRPYNDGTEPCEGVELGVFIIRRSH